MTRVIGRPATKLQSKLLVNLTREEKRACAQLNMRQMGSMQNAFRISLRHCPQRSRAIMIKDRETGRLLAWALLFPSDFRDPHGQGREKSLHTYVRCSHRRLGYGSRLVRAVVRSEQNVRAVGWDRRSTLFYEQFDSQLDLKRWWRDRSSDIKQA